MSEQITLAEADEIALAQLHVLAILARHTENTADDWLVTLCQNNADARAFVFNWLGLTDETQQLMDLSALPFLGDLAKYGQTITQLLAVLNQLKQYAPQILAAFEVLKQLLAAFKPAVPAPSEPVPVPRPQF